MKVCLKCGAARDRPVRYPFHCACGAIISEDGSVRMVYVKRRKRGLGDVVAWVIHLFYRRRCPTCPKRQKKLNSWFPFR